MSRNYINKSVKPYCKVCCDAGKDENEYRSHNVRSKPDYYGKTVVTCPVLLANECSYCSKKGHTVKFCPVLTANKKLKTKEEIKDVKKEVKKKVKSGFALLAESSESESEKKITAKVFTKTAAQLVGKQQMPPKVDEFPALSAVKIEVKPTMTGWAAITAKSAKEFQDEKTLQDILAKSIKRTYAPVIKVVEKKKSWAEWSDSDDEDEEEEEKYVVPSYTNYYYEEEW
jgi:hypothetical protein